MEVLVNIRCEQCDFYSNGRQEVENEGQATSFSQTIIAIMKVHNQESGHRGFVIFDRQINAHQWFLTKTLNTFIMEAIDQ